MTDNVDAVDVVDDMYDVGDANDVNAVNDVNDVNDVNGVNHVNDLNDEDDVNGKVVRSWEGPSVEHVVDKSEAGAERDLMDVLEVKIRGAGEGGDGCVYHQFEIEDASAVVEAWKVMGELEIRRARVLV